LSSLFDNSVTLCDFRFSTQTLGQVALPAAAFQVVPGYDGENRGTTLFYNGGSGNSANFYAQIPDSIPNDSQIVTVGIRYFNTSASDSSTITVYIQELDYLTSNTYDTLDSHAFTADPSDQLYNTTPFLCSINKEKPTVFRILISGDADTYIYAVTIQYISNRVNINQS
jgi:hypothetical protein